MAGGAAPRPEHSTAPEPQSPVAQVNLPGVLAAERAAPDAAGPGGGDGDGERLARGEGEAGGGRRRDAGVGEDARPHRVAAPVAYGERRSLCSW